jgi:uncharacterized membrane protein
MSEQIVDNEITQDDKLWALLAYVCIPPVIAPLIILLSDDKKERPFLRYHAVQSLAGLFIAGVSCIPLIGCCLSPLYALIYAYFGLKAYDGQWVEIPYLTNFLRGQGWLE